MQCRYNLSRIFFGGFFIRGHPYTMETISFAIRFWSKVRDQFAASSAIHGVPPWHVIDVCREKWRPCFFGMRGSWEQVCLSRAAAKADLFLLASTHLGIVHFAVGAFMKVQALQTLQGTGAKDAHKVSLLVNLWHGE